MQFSCYGLLHPRGVPQSFHPNLSIAPIAISGAWCFRMSATIIVLLSNTCPFHRVSECRSIVCSVVFPSCIVRQPYPAILVQVVYMFPIHVSDESLGQCCMYSVAVASSDSGIVYSRFVRHTRLFSIQSLSFVYPLHHSYSDLYIAFLLKWLSIVRASVILFEGNTNSLWLLIAVAFRDMWGN